MNNNNDRFDQELDGFMNQIFRITKLIIYGFFGLILWATIKILTLEDPNDANDETNRMMVYKYKIIHCDGREKVVVQERTEKNPPSKNRIHGGSSTAYIPTWEGYYNVCDIEILEAKIK